MSAQLPTSTTIHSAHFQKEEDMRTRGTGAGARARARKRCLMGRLCGLKLRTVWVGRCSIRSHRVCCSEDLSEASSFRRRASGAAEASQSGGTRHRRRVLRHTKVRCDARVSVKLPRAAQCGLVAPTRLLTVTSTTLTTMRCYCSATPSWRRCCFPRLSALDEMSFTLTHRFAFDIFTTVQRDYMWHSTTDASSR